MNDHTIQEAQRLVDAITDQAERDEANFRAGFEYAARLFYDHGYDVGHAAAEHAEQKLWAGYTLPAIRAAADKPTIAEYQRTLTGPRPGDHPGGPVDWDTGEPTTKPQHQATPRDPWATLPGAAA